MRASTVFRDLRWLVLLAVSLVSVSNAQNGWLTTVDAAYISANQQQGALVFSRANSTYRFTADYSAAGTAIFVTADDIAIDLNGRTITFGTSNRNGTIGIYPFARRSATTLGSDDANYSFTTQTGSGGRNLTVRNGRVIWGGTTGTWAAAIGGMYSAGQQTIDNMYLVSGGMDGSCVRFSWCPITITNTLCINNSRTTENRHMGPATIYSSVNVNASNNIMIGGNSAITCGPNSVIHSNILRHSGFATNGYGVWLYEMTGTRVYSNVIVPTNGRGILYNAGQNNLAYDNLMVSHEKPNAEFGESLNAPGLRIRYGANNNEFRNNWCLAIGGDSVTGGSAAYFSDQGGMRNMVHHNVFSAILTGTNSDTKYANAVTFEFQGGRTSFANDDVRDNVFASNHYLVRLTGWDGGCYQNEIARNELRWVTQNATYDSLVARISDTRYRFAYPSANTYVTPTRRDSVVTAVNAEVRRMIYDKSMVGGRYTFYTGYWTADAMITMIDTKPGPGVGMTASDAYVASANANTADIRIGHSITIQARDTLGRPLTWQKVVVTDNTGERDTFNLDSAGRGRLILIDRVLHKTGTSQTMLQTVHTGHTATIAECATVTLPTDISANDSTPHVITFRGTCRSPVIDPARRGHLQRTAPRRLSLYRLDGRRAGEMLTSGAQTHGLGSGSYLAWDGTRGGFYPVIR